MAADEGSFSQDGPHSPLVGPPDSWLESMSGPSSPPSAPTSGSAELSSSSGPTPVVPPAEPNLGGEARVGRYQILELIGKGGYGRVYKAWDPQLEREVAVKVLLRTDTNAYRRFSREIKLTARLRHPNIVTVYDSGAANGLPFLVMDYVPGRSLWELGKSVHELPPADSARILRDAASAIACAHEQGVLHRDIKPANVLVTPDGHAFVVDFGLARTEEMEKLTQTGAVLGTPLFMPIEQAQAKQVPDELCDVYALGATLYYALTGRPPHVAESLKELIAEMSHLPEAPSALNPLVTPALDAVCLHALMPDRAKRTPTAKAFAEELDGFLSGGSQRRASSTAIDLAGSARRAVARGAELSAKGAGAFARRVTPAIDLLRKKVKGREKLVLTGGYAVVVTLVCASLLIRGQRSAEQSAAAAVATAVAPSPHAVTTPPTPAPTAPPAAAEPEPEPAPAPDAAGPVDAEQALAQARTRAGDDLERQAGLLEREAALRASVLELLHRQVTTQPDPPREQLGLYGILLCRDGPEQAALARPLLDRALAHGKPRAELLFWRGVAAAAAGDLAMAERDWVSSRELDRARIVDLRIRHAEVVPAGARELLVGLSPIPAPEGEIPLPKMGRAAEPALERARALAAVLPEVAREDMVRTLQRAAEGKRWSEVVRQVERLDRWAKDSPVATLVRARVLVGRVRVKEARETLRRARELGANPVELDRLEVELLWRSGRPAEAARAARELAGRDRGPEGRAAGALAHHLGGRHLEALTEARAGLASDPDHLPCLLFESLSLSGLGEPWGGLASARRVHELSGAADELLLAAWIQALAAAGLVDGGAVAVELLLQPLVGTYTESPFPCLVLARAGIDLGNLELAMNSLSKALERDPKSPQAVLLTGALSLVGGGEQKEVDAAWSEARQIDPAIRIEASWAERYRKRFKAEPELKSLVQ